ncbi:DUF4179 domain-containing protein [Paenibacillus glycanilyticus]|uniref:DUF4179 domain-containing protein n=1 Tax=Paenibacillus glycanilyticus TaxID=126569 RepID=A0ABQ6GCG1_9BACL|nr:DUF4179 domain-containing protein [Paenibacillus glycanilyticus]GLX67337.1 hypothetical protein MU1_16820 [Paenibacillus glycanilyticus]
MSDFRDEQERQWPQLEAMKEYTDEILIPPGIDASIWNGIRAARPRRRRKIYTRLAAYTACLLLLVSVASVRFSPVVAAYVGEIPGLRALVELIHYDKGLELALENDFMQPVGLSAVQDGIRMTIDGVIADDSRIVVFYTLENEEKQKSVINLKTVELVDNKDISIASSFYPSEEGWKSIQGTFEFYPNQGAGIPDNLNMRFVLDKVTETATTSPEWQLTVPVDKAKFEGLKEIHDINKTVTVEGQKITFGTMTVYPTRIEVEVNYDPENNKRIFYFDDLRLEDENGETFGTINNGVTGSNISDDQQVLYFQSNYFRKPQQLYLRASSIRALDKDKLEVKVDLEHKKLLTRPDDLLTLNEFDQGILFFGFKDTELKDENTINGSFSNDYRDASGKTFHSSRGGSTITNGVKEIQYYLEQMDYQSPLTLTISDYPTRIHGDIDIKIK